MSYDNFAEKSEELIMRTVYTQDDAANLKHTGQAHRQRGLVYITPVNGVDVEVEGTDAPVGETVAVATDGQTVWPLNQLNLDAFQRAKRPSATKPEPKKK